MTPMSVANKNMALATIQHLTYRRPWLVLTGAGISAASGVPTYRDDEGIWQRKPPVTHQEFMTSHKARQRFWLRNMVGWKFISQAQPNPAHNSLVALERAEAVSGIITQNVDGLHQRAGSCETIDLHGRVDTIVCMNCGAKIARSALQPWMEAHNPSSAAYSASAAPDGDADIDTLDYSSMQVPSCEICGGVLKPDAVFFGDTIPKPRLADCQRKLESACGLVVIGSSLSTYSGYRFCLWASRANKPIVIINQGVTRGDPLATAKITDNCASVLDLWLNSLS